AACASFPPAPRPTTTPAIVGDRLIAADGAALGLAAWTAPEPKAVVVAVHGMNDYSNAFRPLGEALKAQGFAVYAYDQRGFGRSPGFGRWPGSATLKQDLRSAIAAARAAQPGRPLFVLGHSMGAAVVLAAMKDEALDADGVILGAPGVWGSAQMPVLYRLSLNLAAAFTPGKTLTGERTGRQSTDNIPLLRAMYKDPLVIKGTRIDAILGVVRVMGEGYDASKSVKGRILVLTGAKDQIIPVRAQQATAKRLCGEVSAKLYPNGWHMIFSDLGAAAVWRDVGAWMSETAEKGAAGPAVRPGPAAKNCSAGRAA
ncbi:MAG: lysophospholipase, partial [Parvularculaceae bacterium]|nr:lysophospholipase [Parvularculaceae bacterium]